MTAAYAAFANGGTRVTPMVIVRILGPDGRVIFADTPAAGDRLVAAETLTAINTLFAAVVREGTGKAAALENHPAGGKTGTTQGSRDAWFVGFTHDLVAGVWVGNDDGTPMRAVTGGSLPAKIWHDVMAAANAGFARAPLAGLPPTIDDLAALGPEVVDGPVEVVPF